MLKKKSPNRPALLEKCLAAFIEAGTLDLSLEQLADRVGISKRMVVHYFGSRDAIEEQAMTLLEDRLRAQFATQNFPTGVPARVVLHALWATATAPASRGVLLLTLDLSRRAWNGSPRAKSFYLEQQRLWAKLLSRYLPDKKAVDDVLQSFQGAVLGYLVTGDPKPGKGMLDRLSAAPRLQKKSRSARKPRHSS